MLKNEKIPKRIKSWLLSCWSKAFQNGMFPLAFWSFFLLYFLTICLTFQDYGITWDESQHVSYGNGVINYYLSFFQDKSPYLFLYMPSYGGFFDSLAAIISQILPFCPYETKHFIIAMFGFLGVLYAYRTVMLFENEKSKNLKYFALLSSILLVFTPRYYGHSFNNPKDIPFAVLYLVTIYYILASFPYWKTGIPRGSIAKISIAAGCLMGIKIGGLLVYCYYGLFFGLYQLALLYRGEIRFKSVIANLAKSYLLPLFFSYWIMILFWPWAQQNPILNPVIALGFFSNITVGPAYTLFEGIRIPTTSLPWYYVPKWILIETPELVLIGALICISFFFFTQKLNRWNLAFIFFAFFFPIGYVILKRSALYDAIRHFLFLIPLLSILASLGLYFLYSFFLDRIKTKLEYRIWNFLCIVILIIYMSDTIHWYIRSHPNEYVYFNNIAGKIQGAYLRYNLDYWGNSCKQAAEWLNQYASNQNIKSDRKFVVESNGFHAMSIWHYLDPKYFEYDVTLLDEYSLGWNDWRMPRKEWDFFFSRDLSGNIIYQNGAKGIKIKSIDLDGVPLVSIYKREN